MKFMHRKLRYKFTAILFLFALLVAVASSLLYFKVASDRVHEDMRQRLRDIAAAASMVVDVERHDLLRQPEDERSESYLAIRTVLQKLRDASSDIHFIYTMRTGTEGVIEFVVDAETDPEAIAHLGDIYDEPSDLLVTSFATMATPLVESETYTDEWGTWLSGYAPFYREDGSRAGVIGMDIAADTIKVYHRNLMYLALGLFAVTLPFIFLGGLVVSSRLVRPIIAIRDGAEELGRGNLDAHVDVDREDELGQLANSFNEMAVKLKERDALERAKVKAQAASHAKSVFLDNSGQGFLSFGMDRIVEKEFSRECVRLLGGDVAGRRVDELLFPDDEEERSRFNKGVHLILKELDPYRRDLFMSLMPGEIELGEIFTRAEYRVVETDKLMMILTDITAEKQLQRKARQEHERLKLVVSSVRDARDFFEVTGDFEQFREDALQQGAELTDLEQTSGFYREVHTYKGLFSQMDFIHTPEALHELESDLSPLLPEAGKHAGSPDLSGRIEECRQAYMNDLAIIRENLGEDYLESGGRVFISMEHARKLRYLAEALADCGDALSEESRGLIPLLKDLGSEDLRSLLGQYPRAVERLAGRLEKNVAPFSIEGGAVKVDPERFGPFVHSLAHVFRNAVDHGLENEDERFETDKPEQATLSCTVCEQGGHVTVEIVDDGKGVDVEALKDRAMAQGAITEEQARSMSSEDALELVFSMGISSRKQSTALSGRGVGMAAVRETVEALGGTVMLTSQPGKGTVFTAKVPI